MSVVTLHIPAHAEAVHCLGCDAVLAYRWPAGSGWAGRCVIAEGVTPVEQDERGRFRVTCPACGRERRFYNRASRLP